MFTHYSCYSRWLGYILSIECLAGCLLFSRIGDSVDVNIMFSIQVKKSWRMKTIEQRKLTDDRVRLDWLTAVGSTWKWMWMISGHCMQLDYYSIQITWLEFLSHYSHIIFFLSAYSFQVHRWLYADCSSSTLHIFFNMETDVCRRVIHWTVYAIIPTFCSTFCCSAVPYTLLHFCYL